MKQTIVASFAAAGFALLADVHAQVDARKAEAAARDAGCMACHAVASRKVGQSFKELGSTYRGGADKLIADLKANKEHADALRRTKDDDLKLIAAWIVTL
jgi:cytochrome c551/c552